MEYYYDKIKKEKELRRKVHLSRVKRFEDILKLEEAKVIIFNVLNKCGA